MFLLSFSRIIRFSAQNFVRNIWLSVVTITIIILTLFSVTSLIFVNAVMDEAIKIVRSKVDVSVFFKPTASPEQVLAVQAGLEKLDYVAKVDYVSKSEGLEQVRALYQDSPLIIESIKELENNPLGDTLVVSTQETADYQKIVDIMKATPQYAALVDKTSFDGNTYIIDKLERISRQLDLIGWGVTIFFALISILVIINTIRIAIYTHRDEIAIMRLVGAGNWFIRGPFVGEAVIYAVIGSVITFVLTFLATNFADPYVSGLLGSASFGLLAYLKSNMLLIFGIELLGIIFISVSATSLALGRYLKI